MSQAVGSLYQAIKTSPSPALSSAIRLTVRAILRPRKRERAKAVTGDMRSRLIATSTPGNLRDLGSRAILIVASASGGKRRSEIASLSIEPLKQKWPTRIVAAPYPPFPFILVAPRPAAPTKMKWFVSAIDRLSPECVACSCEDRQKPVFSGQSIGGAVFCVGRWTRRPSTTSSSGG